MTVAAVMEVPQELLAGGRVLVLWHQAHRPEAMQSVLEGLRERVGGGEVLLEHAERLILGETIFYTSSLNPRERI